MKMTGRRLAQSLCAAVVAGIILGSPLLFPAPTQATSSHDDSTIVVWTDDVRFPGFQLYQKTHPEVHLRIVINGDLVKKVLLYNRIGSGWPDAVFDDPRDVATLSHSPWNYTADLTPLVPAATIKLFAPGPLAQCRIGGKLYCLRNDIGQNVLWYNAKLMKQFGYRVPTTWEEYQRLGLRLGKEHPGYIIGSFGDLFGAYAYFWPSGCPTNELVGVDRVRINLSAPTCTRVASLLQPLLDNGTVVKLGFFDPELAKIGAQDKILMLVGASWFGKFVFQPAYKTPPGELAAAPPLRWAGEKVAWTGAEGGGAYFVSAHARNPAAAARVITWMCTSNLYQASSPTFPAYLPAADAWAKTIAHDRFFAANPYPVLQQAASLIRPSWSYVRYDTEGAFAGAVINGVVAHKSVASTLASWQDQLDKLARIAGYTVIH